MVQHYQDERFGCQHFITIVSSRLVNGLLNRGSQWHNIIRMFVRCPIFSGWVRHSLHFTKSIPTEYHLLSSRLPSSLCQIAKSSLWSHQAHFCQIVHFMSPSLPTPHHQCYVANSPNPLDCPKCSSKFPGLKFDGLPNTRNVFLFCHQQRRLPNFRNALKPLYFSPFDGSCKLWEQPFQASTYRDFFLNCILRTGFQLEFYVSFCVFNLYKQCAI